MLEIEIKMIFGYDFCSEIISRLKESSVVQSTVFQQSGRDAPLRNVSVQVQPRVELISFPNGKVDSNRAQTECARPLQF